MEDVLRKKIREDTAGDGESARVCKKYANQDLTYDVLRIIFRYLNGLELWSASMVCRSWLEAANSEKRTRGPVCTLETVAQDAFVLDNEDNFTIQRIKNDIIKQLPIKVALGLFFAAPYTLYNNKDYHCKVPSRNFDVVVVLGIFGIVMNNKEIEGDTENIACAFLPEIPDVTIRTFSICNTLHKKGKTDSVERCVKEIINALDTPEARSNTSRCLLVFCNVKGAPLAIEALHLLKRSHVGEKYPIWGGIAAHLFVCSSEVNENYLDGSFAQCVAITLSGKMATWSIIIDTNYKTKERVEQRLRKFRSTVSLKKHSIGLMIACCARGQTLYDECNVESSIFRKLFPDVPLVGYFGCGEFGETTIPNVTEKKKLTNYNEDSTVFLIITYG